MQFDYAAGRLSYESADEIIDFITSNGLHLE
jgi:GH35 family endo-1,4-beta-xylanase